MTLIIAHQRALQRRIEIETPGSPFLGCCPVTERRHRVVLVDTEMGENQLRSWLRDQSIRNTSAVEVFTLRGQVSSFDLTNERIRAASNITSARCYSI
jgi:hypothetical protein